MRRSRLRRIHLARETGGARRRPVFRPWSLLLQAGRDYPCTPPVNHAGAPATPRPATPVVRFDIRLPKARLAPIVIAPPTPVIGPPTLPPESLFPLPPSPSGSTSPPPDVPLQTRPSPLVLL